MSPSIVSTPALCLYEDYGWLPSFQSSMTLSSGPPSNLGNAYLEALTAECIYIVAGPEFGEEGHIIIIYKALYGLHSSR